MASSEHKELATFIKSIHRNLREESKIYGPKEAWKRHVLEREKLKKYAESMRKLATEHWAENAADPKKNTNCRIDWVKSQCYEYFFRGGNELYWDREMNIKQKMLTFQEHSNSEILDNISSSIEHTVNLSLKNGGEIVQEKLVGTTEGKSSGITPTISEATKRLNEDITSSKQFGEEEMTKVKLLDVGSCYNPFGNVEYLNVTAVDLAPSCQEVLRCDFLSMKVGQTDIYSEEEEQLLQLRMSSFDTVVFCLLLEYLPSPEQRYTCCEKAYNLLKNGGLLLIVTPDSKHVGANARFMKSWRHVLSNLGFMRIKYEKVPHAHCLVFRKCFHKEVATRWASLKKFSKDDELFQSENKIFIPQDFTTVIEDETVASVPDDENTTFNLYNELPYTLIND